MNRQSPNFGPRQPVDGLVGVRLLVVHYTGMVSAAAALDRLRDPASQVSAHYLIDEDGTTHALVDEAHRAWHAGVAYWRGMRDINSASIGIELVNPGHEFGYRPFPSLQIDTFAALARDIMGRHGLNAWDVVGHSDIAPGRKQDPGELFPWRELAERGIGIWPLAPPLKGEEKGVWPLLAGIGYAVPGGAGADILDPSTAERDVISAFQAHFRPELVDGQADPETLARIAALLP